MVAKRFRRVRAGELNGVIEVVVSGGLPDGDQNSEEAAQQVRKFVADGRAVRVVGGLPDVLMGEQMTPEQRKAHDSATYAAVMGTAGTNAPGTGE